MGESPLQITKGAVDHHASESHLLNGLELMFTEDRRLTVDQLLQTIQRIVSQFWETVVYGHIHIGWSGTENAWFKWRLCRKVWNRYVFTPFADVIYDVAWTSTVLRVTRSDTFHLNTIHLFSNGCWTFLQMWLTMNYTFHWRISFFFATPNENVITKVYELIEHPSYITETYGIISMHYK